MVIYVPGCVETRRSNCTWRIQMPLARAGVQNIRAQTGCHCLSKSAALPLGSAHCAIMCRQQSSPAGKCRVYVYGCKDRQGHSSWHPYQQENHVSNDHQVLCSAGALRYGFLPSLLASFLPSFLDDAAFCKRCSTAAL